MRNKPAANQASPGAVRDYGVLDLETQKSAQEVGGWHRAHKMGLSCAVIWDSRTGQSYAYLEDHLHELLAHL